MAVTCTHWLPLKVVFSFIRDMVSHQSSSGSHTQATINRNVSRGTLSRNWCSSFLIGTVTNPTNCRKCKTTNLLVRFFRYLWNIIQPIWNFRCDSTKPRRFTTYWVCWLWNSETETCNGTLRKHNCSQFAISNIFYILTFVIVFLAVVWATRNTNMLSVLHLDQPASSFHNIENKTKSCA